MNRLFGAKKKEEAKPEEKPEDKQTMSEVSGKLEERGNSIQAKVDQCNKELMEIKKEMLTAKGMRKKTLQQKAMHVLKRRKMYDTQVGHL